MSTLWVVPAALIALSTLCFGFAAGMTTAFRIYNQRWPWQKDSTR